ncbi:hypothetical protein RM549_02175 [Salegentibacter sp. F188]|uniref:Membrane metalloprotease n=1 Tax=Autumnicola patrickiae TaxID=3075591 RepID=A0ABU3DXW8_9FLAO|nr:hypothetical protein [Salegentibacter sp. F188]MDT0688571.1 hypothetical protein [Salegentibacter sp. F188]
MYSRKKKLTCTRSKINKFFLLLSLLCLSVSCSTEEDNDLSDRIDKSVNLRGLGESARELLSDEEFKSMNVEMVYVEGNQPTETAIATFKAFLEGRTFKPDGINISLRAVPSSGKAPFSIEEIVEIEKETRTVYNAGDEIAVFIYFADGSHENDENNKFTLGSAFRNTSMVIYQKTITDFSSGIGSPSKSTVEAAVLNHEFGHLFGLVNIGTELQSDHADPENDGHCSSAGCLMRSSIEFGSGILELIDENGVPEIDSECIRDLQANGGR